MYSSVQQRFHADPLDSTAGSAEVTEALALDEPQIESAECPDHGPFEQKVFTPFPGERAIHSGCPVCASERKAEQDAAQAQKTLVARQVAAESLLEASGVPLRFRDRTFAEYKPPTAAAKTALSVCKRYAEDFAGQAQRGRSLVLTGGPGTGKTHLACVIASTVINAELAKVRFVTVSDMLRRIKETYAKDSPLTESNVIAGFSNCDLLIVDEVGVQVGSEHEKLLLFDVLNARYQDLKPSILISNLSAEELETFLGHRVMDRYRECGVVLAFDWASHRGMK